MRVSKLTGSRSGWMVIDEPLELSAPLARQLASRLCRKNPATGDSCEWDHGFWQYLRILGLAAPPKRHADFYREAFEQLVDSGSRPRILISGAADYGMLALVLVAFRERGIEPQVTVVDVCETPLALNRWFAERESVEIHTHCSDILSYTSDVPFDLICTHAFLGHVFPTQRPALIANWHTLLRPGGAVVTVAPIRPGAAHELTRFTPAQAAAFCAAALKRATEMRGVLDIEPEEALRVAKKTVSQRGTYARTSLEEIRSLFEQAGFIMKRLSFVPLIAGADPEVSGPATSGSANYAHIIAIRE
jgi:2-polyprenyl-3-methyl-5-hydroxy-6-metoxy-1,4-benzoquinol methylase